MSDRPIHVLFLCLGNICRSPLAEGQFRAFVDAAGTAHRFVIDSAGTSGYHKGSLPDRGSIAVAKKHGLDITDQRSRPLQEVDFERFDFIVAMDRRNLSAIAPRMSKERGFLLREFDDQATGSLDVPDPYGGGANGFDEVYAIIDRSVPALAEYLERTGPRP